MLGGSFVVVFFVAAPQKGKIIIFYGVFFSESTYCSVLGSFCDNLNCYYFLYHYVTRILWLNDCQSFMCIYTMVFIIMGYVEGQPSTWPSQAQNIY